MPRPALRSILATQTLDPLSWSPFVAGQTRREQLERGRPLRELRMRCTIDYTVTTLGAPVFAEDAPFNALNRVRVRRAGGEPRVDLSGFSLEVVRQYEQGTPSFVSLPAPVVGANQAEFDVTVPFAPANSPFQRGWGLLLPNEGTDTIEIEAADIAAVLFATAPTAFTIDALTVEMVQAEEASPHGARLIAAHSPWREPLVRHLIETEDTLSAVANHSPVPRNNIGTGGDLEAAWFISRSSATGLRTDAATYGRMRLRYGRVTILEELYNNVRRRQKATTGLETLLAGVLYLPHDVERLLDSTVDLGAQPGTRYELDTVAAADVNLTLVRSEVYPQRMGRRPA